MLHGEEAAHLGTDRGPTAGVPAQAGRITRAAKERNATRDLDGLGVAGDLFAEAGSR